MRIATPTRVKEHGEFIASHQAAMLVFLMDNHIHLVAVPDECISLDVALRRAHGRYSLYLNARRHRTGHLWQNRFYSCALDERHLWTAVRYVELNPVRALLVGRPGEYEWSSAPAHLGLVPIGALPDAEFHDQAGGAERWTGLLAEPEELVAIRALQRGTFTGRPVGDEAFVQRLEAQLNRTLVPHQGRHIDLAEASAAAF